MFVHLGKDLIMEKCDSSWEVPDIKIKQRDLLEMKLTGYNSIKEFLETHLDYSDNILYVIYYKGIPSAILGIDESNSLVFTTVDLDRIRGYMVMKYFNKALHYVMEDEVYAYIDVKYDTSIDMVLKKDFKEVESDTEGFRKFAYIRGL